MKKHQLLRNHIIINATAVDKNGALTILRQFIDAVPDDKYQYIVFVYKDVKLPLNKTNVILIKKDVKTNLKRFLWDTCGLNNWLKERKIKPLVTLSLQNTNVRINISTPNFIYYHQPIPLFNKKWNPLKKRERLLWFYKKIYPSFVKLFINNKTEVFVQLNYIKEGFAKSFGFPEDKIHVISPKIKLPTVEETVNASLDKNQLNLFYPAALYIYKNHIIILKALSIIERELQKKITLNLTCDRQEFMNIFGDNKTLYKINFMGRISFKKVLGIYKEADALLFPSFIETFGLPLIEAASFGLPIIAADLPYSHEVLHSYEGVRFAMYNNAKLWEDEISKLFLLKGKRYNPIKIEESNSWQELFRIIKSQIQIRV